MRLAAVTSSANEVSGSCTMVTWNPCLVRISYTGLHPDASTQAPCTSTMFLTGSAIAGALAETRESTVATASNPLSFVMSLPQALTQHKIIRLQVSGSNEGE